MNNAQRKAAAARRRGDVVTYVRDDRGSRLPLRYLTPDERRWFLARATSPLEAR